MCLAEKITHESCVHMLHVDIGVIVKSLKCRNWDKTNIKFIIIIITSFFFFLFFYIKKLLIQIITQLKKNHTQQTLSIESLRQTEEQSVGFIW